MPNKEEDKQKLLKMPDMTYAYINWFSDGGGQVARVNFDYYVLFEVPMYGGEPRYTDIYHISKIDELLDLAYSWT